MARETVQTLITEYYDITTKYYHEVEPELDRLLKEGKISGGDRWYIRSMSYCYHDKAIQELIDKAHKKVEKGYKGGYTQALNDVASKSMWRIMMNSLREFDTTNREYITQVDAGLAGIGITYTLNNEKEEK